MCGCEPGFICPKCRGTRLADDYLDDEPRDELQPEVFEPNDWTATNWPPRVIVRAS